MTNRILTGNPTGGTVTTTTDRNLTLYVRTTGSDTNNGLTTGTALLTIQAAIDKIPTVVKHLVTIDIGAGNFMGFRLANKMIQCYSGQTVSTSWPITIQGAAFANFTPATGTGSGTSTGGTTTTLIDIGQTWTAHDLRGKVLYANGNYLIIRDNNGTSLETVGVNTSMSGVAYQIMDWSTKITNYPSGYALDAPINISNCSGARALYMAVKMDKIAVVFPSAYSGSVGESFLGTGSDVYLTYCSFNGSGKAISTMFSYSRNARLQNIYSCNNTGYGMEFIGVAFIRELKNIFIYNVGSNGIMLLNTAMDTGDYVYTDNCTNAGLRVIGISEYAGGHQFASACGGAGIEIHGSNTFVISAGTIDSCSIGVAVNCSGTLSTFSGWDGGSGCNLGSVTLSNNTNGGLVVGPNAVARLAACTGTGNTGYGIYCFEGGRAVITSATTVTGSLGDATINDGVTPLTWATHFASNGDRATNLSNGSYILRKD